jgi:hypothetical protein
MAEILFKRPSGGESVIISMDCTIEEIHMTSAAVTEYAVEKGANISDHVRAENDRLIMDVMISNTPITDKRSRAPAEGQAPQHSHMDGAVGERTPASLESFVQSSPRRRSGDPIMVNPGRAPQTLRGVGSAIQLSTFAVGVGSPALAGLNILGSIQVPGTPPEFQAQAEEQQRTIPVSPEVLQFATKFDRVRGVYEELRAIQRTGTVVTIITSLRQYDTMVIERVTAPRTAAVGHALRFTIEAKQVRIGTTQTVSLTDPVQPRDKAKANKGNKATVPANAAEEKKTNASTLQLMSTDGILGGAKKRLASLGF